MSSVCHGYVVCYEQFVIGKYFVMDNEHVCHCRITELARIQITVLCKTQNFLRKKEKINEKKEKMSSNFKPASEHDVCNGWSTTAAVQQC